jgi:hypothetical protein
MKKIIGLLAVMMLAFMVGCGAKEEKTASSPAASPVDAQTSASVVNNADAFEKAISKDGTWIAATLNDLKIDKDLVLEGEFTNKDKPARKIALYTQDADHKVTASFKLTAPKLTIKSENARIQGGTFVGDVYVEANGFTIVNATVEGNLYFANDEYKASFVPAEDGKVTGETAVKAQ